MVNTAMKVRFSRMIQKIALVGILLMCAGFVVVVVWPGILGNFLQGKSDSGKSIDPGELFQGSPMVDSDSWANVRLPDTNGDILGLSDFQGKVVFLNFWATWCRSCVSEMADMQKLHQKLNGKAFVMIAINIKESQTHVKNFLETQNLTFTTLLDPDGITLGRFGVRALPTTLILNKSGRLIETIIGPRNWTSRSSLAKFKYLIDQGVDES
jgi:peroxiredoxin